MAWATWGADWEHTTAADQHSVSSNIKACGVMIPGLQVTVGSG